MLSPQAIAVTSIFFWLLPPFRQFKTKYFFYFLILALSDPITYLYLKVFGYPLYLVHSFASMLTYFVIMYKSEQKKYNVILFILLISGLLVGMLLVDNLQILVLIFNALVLFKFIKTAVIPIFFNNNLNLFYLALIFYELSIVTNVAIALGGGQIKVPLFFVTLSFQILLAIFFTIFTDKSPSLNIQLRSKPQ